MKEECEEIIHVEVTIKGIGELVTQMKDVRVYGVYIRTYIYLYD